MTDHLDTEALEAGAKAMYDEEPWNKNRYSNESFRWEELQEGDRQAFLEEAETVVSAYFATLPYPRPGTLIKTAEELDQLPVFTVIRTDNGWVYERRNLGWMTIGLSDFVDLSANLLFPATLLWVPTKERKQS